MNEPLLTDTPNITHDQLFKLLLTMFFRQFLQLFLPQVAAYTDFSTLTPLDKETLTTLADQTKADAGHTPAGKRESDIVMQARYNQQGQAALAAQPPAPYQRRQNRANRIAAATFAIHIENQASNQAHFPQRMFQYFARLSQRYNMDIYPVAVLSFNNPRRAAPHRYQVRFPNKEVLNFDYDVIQLNRLDWHDYINQPNPVASALMAKMHIAPQDRPLVKAHCTAMLFGLKLDQEQQQLIASFVETYLPLEGVAKAEFKQELERLIPPQQKEATMQLLNSWQKEGLEQGLAEGRQTGLAEGRQTGLAEGRQTGLAEGRQTGLIDGQRELILRLLGRKFGELTLGQQQQIGQLGSVQLGALGEALLDFSSPSALNEWLAAHRS